MTKFTSCRRISQLANATSDSFPYQLSGMPYFPEVLALAQDWPEVKETRLGTMPWIETIEIRSLKTSDADWLKAINVVTNDITQTDPDVSIEILRNASIETDLIIELTHHSGEVEVEGSSTGVRLASMCASLGLVNHNVWLAERRRVGQERISNI